jgi:hypothetical protein
LEALIACEIEMALDPAISSRAQSLIDKSKAISPSAEQALRMAADKCGEIEDDYLALSDNVYPHKDKYAAAAASCRNEILSLTNKQDTSLQPLDMKGMHYEYPVVDPTEESDAGVRPVLVPDGYKIVQDTSAEQGEPVAWMTLIFGDDEHDEEVVFSDNEAAAYGHGKRSEVTPLYTSPPSADAMLRLAIDGLNIAVGWMPEKRKIGGVHNGYWEPSGSALLADRDKVLRIIETLTLKRPTDMVVMSREELEGFGMRVATEAIALDLYPYDDEDEEIVQGKLRALVSRVKEGE